MQLEESRSQFEALGVNVAGMTYDGREIAAAFHEKAGLGYPLLQDVDADHVKRLKVINPEYPPGHRAYGVPLPGIVYLSPEGKVLAKFAVPGYRERPPIDALLERLTEMTSGG